MNLTLFNSYFKRATLAAFKVEVNKKLFNAFGSKTAGSEIKPDVLFLKDKLFDEVTIFGISPSKLELEVNAPNITFTATWLNDKDGVQYDLEYVLTVDTSSDDGFDPESSIRLSMHETGMREVMDTAEKFFE